MALLNDSRMGRRHVSESRACTGPLESAIESVPPDALAPSPAKVGSAADDEEPRLLDTHACCPDCGSPAAAKDVVRAGDDSAHRVTGYRSLEASRSSSTRLRCTPQRQPPSVPPFRTTRWQGPATASGLEAHARATARAAFGEPTRSAIAR